MDIKEWVLSQREDMLDTATELMKIRSVSEPGTRGHPYREGCAMVLDKALEIGKQVSFETENHGYRCGGILMPGRTGQEIGIFVHLDVMHEGNGWTTEPYKPVVKDGWLYGRGGADNKGPAATALYSMKCLKEQEVPLEYTIRLYLRCSEEREMEDIEYYTSHYPAPGSSFIPDASFPVCYGEKGILEGRFSCAIPEGHVTGFSAEMASNAVPAEAWVWLSRTSCDAVRDYVDSLDNPQDFIVEGGSQIVIKTAGKTAHAAFPEGPDSAAVKLVHILAKAPLLTEEGQACFRFLDQGFADYHGEGMDITFEDGLSGRLILVGGMARTERGRFIQNFNTRYPVIAGAEVLVKQMSTQAGKYGWILDWSQDSPPCVIDPESLVVKELIALCRQVLGAETKAYSMGGGTYARKLPNAVTFGPGIRGQKKSCPPGHGGGYQLDEYVKIENLTNAMAIYIEALKRLDVLIGE